jgi:hypothetical protein
MLEALLPGSVLVITALTMYYALTGTVGRPTEITKKDHWRGFEPDSTRFFDYVDEMFRTGQQVTIHGRHTDNKAEVFVELDGEPLLPTRIPSMRLNKLAMRGAKVVYLMNE